VEQGKLGPLADRVIAEACGLARQMVEHHEQLAECVAGLESGTGSTVGRS